MTDTPIKVCSTCRVGKPATEFHRCAPNKDGLQYQCKKCRKVYQQRNIEAVRRAKRAHYARNSEHEKKRTKAYRKANPNRVRQTRAESYARNAEKNRERCRKWRQVNPGRASTDSIAWRIANPGRATQLSLAWAKANRPRCNAHTGEYRATKLQATPAWADLGAIEDVYKEAAYIGLTVDHIVPLQSKLVCGLHVWDNLQLLSKRENSSKKNRHWPDMP